MGPYKPLRTWVDEFIPYHMEMSWELIDPIAQIFRAFRVATSSVGVVEHQPSSCLPGLYAERSGDLGTFYG